MKEVTKHLKVTCNVTDKKRQGKIVEERDRTLIVKIDSDYAKRLTLLSLGKMKEYKTPVFISKKLNSDEQVVEYDLCKNAEK